MLLDLVLDKALKRNTDVSVGKKLLKGVCRVVADSDCSLTKEKPKYIGSHHMELDYDKYGNRRY